MTGTKGDLEKVFENLPQDPGGQTPDRVRARDKHRMRAPVSENLLKPLGIIKQINEANGEHLINFGFADRQRPWVDLS